MLNTLPHFSTINPATIAPSLRDILTDNRQQIADLLASTDDYTWDNLITPLQQLEDRLDKFWSPISHVNGVANTPAIREAYNACLPALTDYGVWLGQHQGLYQAYQTIKDKCAAELSATQQQVIDHALRDFRLAGIGLAPAQQQRYQQISQRLSTLQTIFEENLLDASDSWQHHVTDEALLSGLPDTALATAQQKAQQKNLPGYLFSLDIPCYIAVITYADNRELREHFYRAWCTRGSALFAEGNFDNTAIMQEILQLRQEKAQLLGFADYVDYSLATKMADSAQQIDDFFQQLITPAKRKAQQELAELEQFARQFTDIPLQSWDITYYAEKLKQQRFALDSEALRVYFPLPKVLDGMFSIIQRLYGIRISEKTGIDTWHPDVQFFCLYDAEDKLRGGFYIDLYSREQKRGGAWMAECITRCHTAEGIQLPVAFLNCNFSAPVDDKPALLTHDEVVTLFHECGHSLHHLLTQQVYPEISGINGVPWDAVELPSQFFENWCWDAKAIALCSGHYETGEALPESLLQQLIAAKNFHAALQCVRQVEFSLFDLRLHQVVDLQQANQIYTVLQQVRDQVAVIHPPAWNRFPNSFSHIFAGGYAAGYYSYKWAEVLSADAFAAFLEKGIFDAATGQRFLHCILEAGGSREPQQLFVDFRGREPQVTALLRQDGIADEVAVD